MQRCLQYVASAQEAKAQNPRLIPAPDFRLLKLIYLE